MYDDDEEDDERAARQFYALHGIPQDAQSMGLDRNVPEGAWLAFAGSLSSSKPSHRLVAWLLLIVIILTFVLTLHAELF